MSKRNFIVGETIHFYCRVSEAGSKSPTDPDTVTLRQVKLNGVNVLGAPIVFTRVAEGEYEASLNTTGYATGTYSTFVWVEQTEALPEPQRVRIVEDTFVLVAAP